jgi:hypothetical protein
VKKLFTLGLTLALVLGLASVSMAGTLSLDVIGAGDVDWDNYSEDFSQIAVGLDIPVNEFKLSCDLSTGTVESNGYDYDTTGILLKGGYNVINERQLRLDLTAGFYDRKINWDYYWDEPTNTTSYYSFIVGFDAKLKLDRKAWVDFKYSYGISPHCDNEDWGETYSYSVDSLSIFDCKFNLLLNPEFGVSLGYHNEIIDYEYLDHETFSGVTIGAFFRF